MSREHVSIKIVLTEEATLTGPHGTFDVALSFLGAVGTALGGRLVVGTHKGVQQGPLHRRRFSLCFARASGSSFGVSAAMSNQQMLVAKGSSTRLALIGLPSFMDSGHVYLQGVLGRERATPTALPLAPMISTVESKMHIP